MKGKLSVQSVQRAGIWCESVILTVSSVLEWLMMN